MEDQILDSEYTNSEIQRGEYAGFWARVFASLIDVVVMIPFIVMMILNVLFLKSLMVDFLILILIMIYKPFFEYKYSGTFGKMALKIKVVTEQFNPIDLQTSLIRNLIYIIPSFIGLYHSTIVFNHPEFADIDSFFDYADLLEEVPDAFEDISNIIITIAILAVAFTAKKQGLHDLLAKTVCIYKEK